MPKTDKKNQFSQIGQNIKFVREHRMFWSPEVFAEMMEVTTHTVYNWENGHTDPRYSRVNKIAKKFKMTLSELDTVHEKQPFVSIHAENDNHVVNHNGVIPSDSDLVGILVEELRSQLSKKDEQLTKKDDRIAFLEKRIDAMVDRLGGN